MFVQTVVKSFGTASPNSPLIPTSAVDIISLVDVITSGRRFSLRARRLTSANELASMVTGVQVLFIVALIVEDVGYSSGQEAYDTLSGNLQTAVDNKDFQNSLIQASPAAFGSLTDVAVAITEPVIVIEKSPSPTISPTTPSPSLVPSKAPVVVVETSSQGISTQAPGLSIAAQVLISLTVIFIVGVWFYVIFKRYLESNLVERATEIDHRLSTSNLYSTAKGSFLGFNFIPGKMY